MIHDDAVMLLAAGAVLDDLAPDELAAYEVHRAGCAGCRRLELELDHVLADLALVVPERVPPPEMLDGIRRALAAETRVATTTATLPAAALASPGHPAALPRRVAATPALVLPRRHASRAPLYASLALAAGLGVVALGLGIRSAGLQQDLLASDARVASLEQALAIRTDTMTSAMTVALDPRHRTVPLDAEPLAPIAEAAVVYVPGAGQSWIVARNLPATPPGKGYQAWYADATGVHPLGTLSFDGNGAFAVPLDVDLADSAAVMLTLEDAGGATGEPGPQVVFGELQEPG